VPPGEVPSPRQDIDRRCTYCFRRREIKNDAADLGFVNNVSRHDLEHHGVSLREQLCSVSDGLLRIGGGERRHHVDLIGLKQPLDLDWIEPAAAVGQRRGNDLPRGMDVGCKLAGHGRRNQRQRLHDLAMPHNMHEAPHRIIFGGIVGNASLAQQIDDLLVRADPDREHRLGQAAALLAVLADETCHG